MSSRQLKPSGRRPGGHGPRGVRPTPRCGDRRASVPLAGRPVHAAAARRGHRPAASCPGAGRWPVLLLVSACASWRAVRAGRRDVFQPWFALLLALYALAAHAELRVADRRCRRRRGRRARRRHPEAGRGGPDGRGRPGLACAGRDRGASVAGSVHRRRTRPLQLSARPAGGRAGQARPRPPGRWPRSAPASPASCTTSSRTAWGSSSSSRRPAQRIARARPEARAAALTPTESTGRQGTGRDAPAARPAQRATAPATLPQPGLRGWTSLVDQLRAAGLRVELYVDGDVRDPARRASTSPRTGSCRRR